MAEKCFYLEVYSPLIHTCYYLILPSLPLHRIKNSGKGVCVIRNPVDNDKTDKIIVRAQTNIEVSKYSKLPSYYRLYEMGGQNLMVILKTDTKSKKVSRYTNLKYPIFLESVEERSYIDVWKKYLLVYKQT
jgi:hypothetical protein